MSPAERLDEALELSNDIHTWMLDGAKSQCGQSSDEDGWAEVRRRLQTSRSPGSTPIRFEIRAC